MNANENNLMNLQNFVEQALVEIAARHTVLRTAFEVDGDEPVQVLDETATPRLTIRSGVMTDEDVQRFVTEDSQRPFDLALAPLLRATLLVRSAREYILVLTLHHILVDGLSLGILLNVLERVRRCLRCPSSTPTMRPGNAGGSRARRCPDLSTTGKSNCATRRPC